MFSILALTAEALEGFINSGERTLNYSVSVNDFQVTMSVCLMYVCMSVCPLSLAIFFGGLLQFLEANKLSVMKNLFLSFLLIQSLTLFRVFNISILLKFLKNRKLFSIRVGSVTEVSY